MLVIPSWPVFWPLCRSVMTEIRQGLLGVVIFDSGTGWDRGTNRKGGAAGRREVMAVCQGGKALVT